MHAHSQLQANMEQLQQDLGKKDATIAELNQEK